MTDTIENTSFSSRIGEAGRLVIPAPVREALGLHKGRRVVLRVQGERLEVTGAEDALKRAQSIARRHPLPGKRRLSDSLIRDRRQAAGRGD